MKSSPNETSKPLPFELYDSYTREKYQISNNNTVKPGIIKIYSCGPTVYNYQSIGNMRAVWLPDTITSLAKIAGYQVEWTLNITDVGHLVSDGDDGEDKIEKGAKRESKSVQEIIDHYTYNFEEQCQSLNFQIPKGFYNPKATDYIKEQMLLSLLLLVQEGSAYLTEDGIYYDTIGNQKVPAKAETSPDTKSTNFTGRDIVKTDKKHPDDFALWKFVSENNLQKWKFSDFEEIKIFIERIVGKFEEVENREKAEQLRSILHKWGSPGWHSECVCMIAGTLGDKKCNNHDSTNKQKLFSEEFTDGIYFETFSKKPAVIDIHTGGEDHIDIHHKNEILQSEALGFHLSKYWTHNKFVLVDSQKMSKSLGNVFLVTGKKSQTGFDSIEEQGYDPLAYRLMLFEHHYREQMNFTWDKLTQAQNRLYNLRKMTAQIRFFSQENKIDPNSEILEKQRLIQLKPLQEDLNTPKFLERYQDFLQDIVNEIQTKKTLNQKNLNLMTYWEEKFLRLNLLPKIPAEILDLANQRVSAKKEKNYKEADQIRDSINSHHWQIDDYSWGFGLWKQR